MKRSTRLRAVVADNPDVTPPAKAVTIIIKKGDSRFVISKAILFASIWSFEKLMKNDMIPQNKKIPVKADKNENIVFCGIKKPVNIPATATVHQGRYKPSAKARAAVMIEEAINFMINDLNYFEAKLIFHLHFSPSAAADSMNHSL